MSSYYEDEAHSFDHDDMQDFILRTSRFPIIENYVRIPVIALEQERTYDFARIEPHERVWVDCWHEHCPDDAYGPHQHEGGLANREIDPMGLE